MNAKASIIEAAGQARSAPTTGKLSGRLRQRGSNYWIKPKTIKPICICLDVVCLSFIMLVSTK